MKLAYLDSSTWIIRSEGISAYRKKVNDTLLLLRRDDWQFCFSDSVTLEVLLKPNRDGQQSIVDMYNKLFSESIHLATYDFVFRDALYYSKIDNLKAMDAIHVAFAQHYGCRLFVTTDPHFRNLNSLPLSFIDLSQTIIT